MKHFVERGFHLLSRLLAKKHCALVGNMLGTCIWLTSLAQLLAPTLLDMFPARFHKLAYFLLAENERITCTSDLVSHDLVDVGGFLVQRCSLFSIPQIMG